MKISADPTSPDHHNVVHFIDKILVDGVELKFVISLDTDLKQAMCYTLPLVAKRGMCETHFVIGKIDIVWRSIPESQNGLLGGGQKKLFDDLFQDWKARELARKGVTDVEPK